MFEDNYYRKWTGPFSFDLQTIVQKVPAKSGVYQLLYRGEVVYIGISDWSILDRLQKHVKGHGPEHYCPLSN